MLSGKQRLSVERIKRCIGIIGILRMWLEFRSHVYTIKGKAANTAFGYNDIDIMKRYLLPGWRKKHCRIDGLLNRANEDHFRITIGAAIIRVEATIHRLIILCNHYGFRTNDRNR